MSFSLFDHYNFRARISVGIILLSPVLLMLYLQVEMIRKLSTTAIVLVCLFSLANLMIVLSRFYGKKVHSKRKKAEEYLYPSDSHFDMLTKKRFYKTLAAKNSSLNVLVEKQDCPDEEFYEACKSAVHWLRVNTRDSKLVTEENINYGFYRNMLGVKPFGIGISVFLLTVHLLQFWIGFCGNVGNVTPEYLISLVIALLYLALWLFLVNRKIVDFAAENYAEALINSIDTLK